MNIIRIFLFIKNFDLYNKVIKYMVVSYIFMCFFNWIIYFFLKSVLILGDFFSRKNELFLVICSYVWL